MALISTDISVGVGESKPQNKFPTTSGLSLAIQTEVFPLPRETVLSTYALSTNEWVTKVAE